MISQQNIQDTGLAFIAGLLISLLALPILDNLGALNLLPAGYKQLAILLWALLLPCATGFGLYTIHHVFAHRIPVLFQLGKYGIVGILNTVLSAGIFNLLISLSNITQGALVNLFAFVAFIASVTNSFVWNRFWTFGEREHGRIKKQYVMFFMINGFVTLLDLLFIHVGINVLGAPAGFNERVWANIVFFLTIPISFLGNFFGYRRFVFRNLLKAPEVKPENASDKSPNL